MAELAYERYVKARTVDSSEGGRIPSSGDGRKGR